ncbi:MAG: hypothetical protein U0992_23985 [Planctomycetaceae bacterium]
MASRAYVLLPCIAVIGWATLICVAADSTATTPDAKSESAANTPKPELFSGRVVYLQEALAKRKIETAEETAKHVVLETDSGELIPILADWRGRAFYQDEHLRDRKVELIGFRHPGVPYLNVIAVYTFDDEGRRNYTDYWCDVCSIPMYEIQACECCQGQIRLRFQVQELPEYIRNKPGANTAESEK